MLDFNMLDVRMFASQLWLIVFSGLDVWRDESTQDLRTEGDESH